MAGASPLAQVQQLEQKAPRVGQARRAFARGTVKMGPLPPSKKRPRVCMRKPPKRGKTAAALRRYGYSRA